QSREALASLPRAPDASRLSSIFAAAAGGAPSSHYSPSGRAPLKGLARSAMDESGSDDVLRLVLERVDSHVSLIRAAAVCRRWRRAIADAAFLRRYRSLHAPAVAGGNRNCVGGLHSRVGPVFSTSAPSVVDARHF
ncbi:unnamed protein product, partial [Urochloa humidicola]